MCDTMCRLDEQGKCVMRAVCGQCGDVLSHSDCAWQEHCAAKHPQLVGLPEVSHA